MSREKYAPFVVDASFGEQTPLLQRICVSADAKESVLEEAQRIVMGERESAYKHPYDCFTRIAKLWDAILGVPITAEQVALMMIALKISRQCEGNKRDNITDICGYAFCLQRVIDRREELNGAP